ncbi:SusC/RagA family TonB-linked outer membrane protein [Leyella stercorea]|uniref:SusC/RagA family TonB-linked outer membrane protein n=1 Tax=Leyella stercorea TaxID=363265 RepID=UPI00242C46F5|nr:SusC/RagA family TonB-linked outer membrane protein [Leyella stercorea]
MNNKSNEKSSMVLKAAFAMLAAGMPMQYASANGNVAPNALTQAQGSVVQGTVKDGIGEPLIGVSVVVKGATGLGVVTDIDGNYKINVKDKNAVLVFSYIGYTPQEVKIGGRSSVDVTMKDESSVLKEVVVTAMGIKRKESSLTYSTQQVKASDLNRVQDPNVANSLEGKVSGVTITPSAGGAGGASKIILRGNKSILGSSTPLIVVDGVPMNNSQRGQVGSGANMLTTGVSEGGDALSMINPDDIESINVLKGANAAALYGSEAANGVLMITTKKGREGKVGVNFSSNVTFDTPLTTPKIQNIYGAAIDEKAGTLALTSWGDKLSARNNDQLLINTPMYGEHFDGTKFENNEVHLRNRAGNDLNDFFKTGVTTNNSIALSGGTDKMSSYFSYGNSHSNGMIENNSYNRHTFSFRQNFKLYDRATIDVSMNYIQTKTKNRPGGGITMNPIFHMYMMPRNIDINYYRNNYRVDNAQWYTGLQTYFKKNSDYFAQDKNDPDKYNPVSAYDKVTEKALIEGQPMQNWAYSAQGQNNPYWLMNQNSSVAKEDRFFGNVTGTLDIYDGLSFQARLGMDFSKYESESKRYATTWLPASMETFGRYWWSFSKTTDLYTDFMLNYNKTFGDWDVSATAGYVGHIRKSYGKGTDVNATYYFGDREHISSIANYFSTAAGGPGATSPSQSSDWNKGAVVTGQIGWKEMVYFDGSYRRDWYRAFRQFKDRGTPEDYGYFGFGANAIVSNIVKMPEWFNYLKYRASYSEVGNSIPGTVFAAGSTNYQTGAFSASQWATFKDPRPEKTASFETGFEALFLKNRLSLDVTYYNSTMSNLYLVGTNASGKSIPMNSAKIRNQGIEATVGYDFKFGQLRWKTSYNLSYNDNKILRTAYDAKTGKENVIATYVGGVQVLYKEGGSMGDMYVTDLKRDANGYYFVSDDGELSMETESEKTYGKFVGNQNAKWQMGWSNTFTWKDLSLSFLINGRIGGKVLSMTESYLDGYGLSQRTADARLYAEKNNIYADPCYGNNLLGIALDDGSGRVVPIDAYYNSVGGVTPQDIERYLYSGTNFRLRELSLGYTFRNLFGQNKNLSLSFIARNLFFIYKDAPVDPDVSLSTGTGLGAFEVFNMPSSRSFGFSLNVNF